MTDAEQETRQVSVPYIDINPPGGRNREERTITMEVDVPNAGYQLQIMEVRAASDNLRVIANLTRAADQPSAQVMTRVSDQVIVNAPEDIDVRKVIVGERPEGAYNQQHRFVDSMAALDQQLKGGRVLYQRGATPPQSN